MRPGAVGEADAGGRIHEEHPHAYRTCFQRDRDRIVHCSAFRRLDYKTQVFVPHVHDHYRTRLTHTLEVAQIARSLARALRLNEDLAEAVALAHDLGHPPFGHAGEEVLDELMANHGHFEHNRQSLRVVDYLEHPYPAFRGLNLTAAVRECLAKHATRYDTPAADAFDLRRRAPLEGQLVDLCDEIAYTSADVDDALQARWITPEALGKLDLWRLAWDQALAADPGARPIHTQIRATKGILAILADDVVATTGRRLDDAAPADLEAVRDAPQRLVACSDPVRAALDQLGDFMYREVYLHPANRRSTDEGRHLIRDLFARFAAAPDALPGRYARRIEADGLHRVVCDYIAGMTDRFCRDEHRRLCGGGRG
ncbi:MAG: deoxyguanosinetriphosphate triphosphohydrolase [Planctomycetes bacterium]|nr:deoxyguanosinetriphosphate triphosphohydrolase [Planctomycetota bacterium]